MTGRARRLSAVLALATVLLTTGGCFRQAPPQPPFVASSPGGNATPAPPPTPFAGIGASAHPGFPANPVSWLTLAPPLPADRPVGPASLVVRDADLTGARIVMPNGAQWTVSAGEPVTLSPDGRWLGYLDGANFVFRDLASTEVRNVAGFKGPRPDRSWSPNGRWLIGAVVGQSDPLLDLASGRIVDVPNAADTEGAPTDEGDLVRGVCPDGEREELRVRVLHPGDPRTPQTVPFDATWHLHGGEQVVRRPTRAGAEDNAAECRFITGHRDEGYLAVFDTPPGGGTWTDIKRARAFLVVSLRTGGLLRRVDLDRPLVLSTQDWILGTLGDALLVRHFDGEDQAAQDRASELWCVDMRTGTVTTVARVGPGLRVIAPGQAG
jgi:hypothetical protein